MILVFGSINLDLIFPTPALPCPGETVLTPRLLMAPGGKGANQAVAAAHAGAQVAMVGCVGGDPFAGRALAGLREAGVDLSRVETVDSSTGCAAVCVDPAGENQIVVASGANLAARADRVSDALLSPGTTVLLQQEVPPEENAKLIARARARGARIVLNAAPAGAPDADLLRAVDVLVVNTVEAAMIAGRLGLGGSEAKGSRAGEASVAVAQTLQGALGVAVVLTLGGQGAFARDGSQEWSVGALDITPVDTVGAGDAFCGYLAAALDAGETLPKALRRASVAAGLACLGEGAQSAIPSAEAVAARLGDLP